MPKVKNEISYKALKSYLEDLEKKQQSGGFAPVYLLYGEELLYKTALKELLQVLMPAGTRSLNYEPMEGTGSNIQVAIERVNTYSLMPGTKVVAICDTNIFYSKQDESKLISKAKEAYANNDHKNAAKYFLNILGMLNLSFDDLRHENRAKALKLDKGGLSDEQWLNDIIDYCLENNLPIPAADDNAEIVGQAISKGFPRGNYLIITTDLVDKRKSLYKIIRKEGVIIDCSVPKGDRRADKMAQENTLIDRRDAILERFNKTIDQDAYRAVCEMTGFDLRTFSQNLEKLASYVGDRQNINIEDVNSVIKRTKKDPVYELTNAVSDRNVKSALFYIQSLLAADLHPLQILTAITNQVRKLLLVKRFVESSGISSRHTAAGYSYFKNHIMPVIQEYDRKFLDQIESWESTVSEDAHTAGKSRVKERTIKKSKSAADLMIAKNPHNPYPVYILLQKSEKYTTKELVEAFEFLSQADLRLKSTGQRPKIILEEAILKICRQN